MITTRILRGNDDKTDLVALSREFFEEYAVYHEKFFAIDELCDGDIAGFFSRSLASESGETFIALESARVVGYITISVRTRESFWKVKKEGHISGLMVHRSHRRKGVGTRLWREAMAFFKSRDVSYFTVCTSVNNHGAIRFYERIGMTPLYCHMVGVTSPDWTER
jgi:ribosomal protein S18 acetylase RimI-like enzyme